MKRQRRKLHKTRGLESYYRMEGFDQKREYLDVNGSRYHTTPCFYCGLPATTIDHAYPISALSVLVSTDVRLPESMLFKCPCCMECNAMLGSKIFKTLKGRKGYLKRKIKSKYRKLLEAPSWHPSEIEELGYSLRVTIQASESNKHLIIDRLNW